MGKPRSDRDGAGGALEERAAELAAALSTQQTAEMWLMHTDALTLLANCAVSGSLSERCSVCSERRYPMEITSLVSSTRRRPGCEVWQAAPPQGCPF